MNEAIKLSLPGENDYFTSEAYKSLRTNIQFCGHGIKVICLTSVMANEGKSTIALSIGKSFAELGKKVLVLDTDMRKSVIAGRNTSADSPSGLSEYLIGLKGIEECIYPVEGCSMDVIFSGPYPPNPVELLSSVRFAELMKSFREKYDYVILDTPPLGLVIDAAVTAQLCDGAILVWGSNKVHYKSAQNVIEQIEKGGCKMLGVIRNNRKKQSRSYYSHGKYGKYYRYEYKSKNKI